MTPASRTRSQRASRIRYGNGSSRRRSANALRAWSNDLLMVLIAEAEKAWPHNASVTALTLRVDTPCTYISARVPTKAFSERW